MKTKKEDRCFYCDKKDRKTNHHWQCTCVDIESKKTVQFYVCPECLEKIYKGQQRIKLFDKIKKGK